MLNNDILSKLILGLWLLCAHVTGEMPNVVLLSVDTLRADFLGCYGCPWDISPNIDRLAGQSMVYDNACCETPLTAPSFSAMLTSRYPRMTGAIRNGMGISENTEVITESFRSAGYHTFAVQSNWTLKGRLSGLDRGFERYDDTLEDRRWGIFNGERRAEEVTKTALDMFRERPQNKPCFAWIHYSDPHAPYRYNAGYSPVRHGLRNMDRKERARVKYASEVAYTDFHIGLLLKALPENTNILFAADHGESLYEHGYLGHGRYLHQPGVHIPFFVYAPEISPGRSPLPVEAMDVGPTLLGLAGLSPVDFALGRDLTKEMPAGDRPRFLETYGGAVPRLPGAKKLLRNTSPSSQAVIQDGWKLIRSEGGVTTLYYLQDDKKELKNLRATNPAKFKELNEYLDRWNNANPRVKEGAPELTAEDMEALKSLGYLE